MTAAEHRRLVRVSTEAQRRVKEENALYDLLDEDGENRAVRMFLLLYGGAHGLTVGRMKSHLCASGHPHWPAWVENSPQGAHLTKAGAQLWLRHLFSLEPA